MGWASCGRVEIWINLKINISAGPLPVYRILSLDTRPATQPVPMQVESR